jgi:hypothetical protein
LLLVTSVDDAGPAVGAHPPCVAYPRSSVCEIVSFAGEDYIVERTRPIRSDGSSHPVVEIDGNNVVVTIVPL